MEEGRHSRDRRQRDGVVTHAELRDALRPLYEHQRRTQPALDLYEKMVPLGVTELLPVMLEDARTRAVLATVSHINWRRWGRVSLITGIIYLILTTIGAGMAIARTAGFLH